MKRIYWSIGLIVLLLGAGYGIFLLKSKSVSGAAKRIPCQHEVVCFERIYSMPKLRRVIDLLKARRYTISSRIQKAEYMKSRLFKYVDKSRVDAMVRAAIETQVPRMTQEDVLTDKSLVIDYLIYENDKFHPGKKTDKSKLYEGYLTFSFKLDAKTVYKFQIDFMDEKGTDISERVACAVRSLLSLEIERKE